MEMPMPASTTTTTVGSTAIGVNAPQSEVIRTEILKRLIPGECAEPLVRAMIIDNARLLDPLLNTLDVRDVDGYLREIREIWAMLRLIGGSAGDERVAEVIRGLQFHSVDFLRRQAKFCRDQTYQAVSAESVREEVYESEPVMKEYLDGLLLTYVAWPNHFRLLQFYKEAFLAHGPSGRCLEIGPGHGWLALLQLRAHAENNLVGRDISRHSVQYTTDMLGAAEIAPGRYEVLQHDATTGFDCGDTCFDRIVMAEVLEHVERPDGLLRSAAAHAHEATTIFLSTVVNIEAIDHLYLYRTLPEVREMIDDCGLEITDELAMPLVFASDVCDSYEVAFVGRTKR